MITKQTIFISVSDDLDLAEKYFSIVSVLNNLDMAKREVQMLAFTAVKGNIGSNVLKKEFVERYDSSLATVGNIISKWAKKGLFIKEKKMVYVNKGLLNDFKSNVQLDITLSHVKEG